MLGGFWIKIGDKSNFATRNSREETVYIVYNKGQSEKQLYTVYDKRQSEKQLYTVYDKRRSELPSGWYPG